MNREIKFRGKRIDNGEWVYGFYWEMMVINEQGKETYEPRIITTNFNNKVIPESVGEFTGHILSGQELYESDIIREEVENEEVENDEVENDEGDDRSYYVVVWINEWSMFATVTTEEYSLYLSGGVDKLDPAMFWTFPIEEKENAARKVCGNIYSNPELLKP